MGYYTSTYRTNIFLDKKHFDAVYKKMCELNDFHDLKRGGSFGSNNDPVETDRYPRNKWFSWMDYNYPETCRDMKAILIQLGFSLEFDENGNLIGLDYYDKTGAEDYFISCFAGFVDDGNYIEWKGEENEDYYRFIFRDGKMLKQQGSVSIDYDACEPDVYIFGEPTASDKASIEWWKEFHAKRDLELNNK